MIGAGALPAGVAMARYEPARLADDGRVVGVGRHVALRPEDWIGRPFPLGEHLEITGDLTAGRWVVVLIDPGCGLCQEVAAKYRRIASDWPGRSDEPRLALISLPGDVSADGLLDDSSFAGNSVVMGRLSDQFTWHVSAPVELTLRDGIVTHFRSATNPRTEDLATF